jgi:hypothetical protein
MKRLILAMLVIAPACAGTPAFADEPQPDRMCFDETDCGCFTRDDGRFIECPPPTFATRPARPLKNADQAPQFTASLYTGTVGVITRGERREFISARGSVTARLAAGVSGFVRGDLTGAQDGGGLDLRDPKTFRTVEVVGGLYRKVGPVEATALAGATYSVEGDHGKPIDARLFTLAALARIGFGDGGYAYGGVGHHGPVGGPALLAAASVPIKGGAYSVFDFAFPLQRTVFAEKAWVLKVGASVRVKRIRF